MLLYICIVVCIPK